MMTETEFLIAFNSADGAYNSETGGGSLTGYTHLDSFEDASTGAKARIYVGDSGNYILAFAGTEDSQDWYQNLASFGVEQWKALAPEIEGFFGSPKTGVRSYMVH